MTIAYEPVCWGAEHAPFNAALLLTLQAAYPDDNLIFFAEREHLVSVRSLVAHPDAGIEWREVRIPRRELKTWRERLPGDWRACSTVVRAAANLRTQRLIACSSTATALAALKVHVLTERRPLTAAVIHHGGISSLLGSRSTRALLSFANDKCLRHIVLGAAIRRSVLSCLPSMAQSIFSMAHPYLFPKDLTSRPLDQRAVRFGFAGVASRSKGFPLFCRLAEDAASAEYQPKRNVRFELIGHLAGTYQHEPPPGFEFVHRTISSSFISRECYDQKLAEVTYLVYPYDPGEYSITSSGAILDSFLHLKPCIVLRNPVFEEYFQAMGNIGYLCDSYEHLRETVRSVSREWPRDLYVRQCENIRCARDIFEPASIAGVLRSILK